MRGLLKAALLLAPALVTALPTKQQDDKAPHALITLDFNGKAEDGFIQETTLELDVLESASPCDYGNITLNGQTLAQDEIGIGSGSITTEHGNIIIANWKFTCMHMGNDLKGQLMTFDVVYVDDKKVEDVGFSIRFQQTAPVSVLFIDGAESIIQTPRLSPPNEEVPHQDEFSTGLENELVELEMMKHELRALEHSIALKVQYIAENFDFKRPEELLSVSECDSLKCIVKAVYHRVKGMASGFYGSNSFGEPHHGKPHWPFHHGKGRHGGRPPFFPPQFHGNHTHGNHTFPPRPPFHDRPPHFHPPPPFCHCPPPPHHGHGPPPPPPPPPPFEGFPHEGFPHDEFPPPPPPPPHHGGHMPPPPPEGPPPPYFDHGKRPHHGPPPPEFFVPGEFEDREPPHGPPFDDGMPPPPPPPPPMEEVESPLPMDEDDAPPPPPPPPPHQGHGWHGGHHPPPPPPPHARPPFDLRHLLATAPVLHILVMVIVLILLSSALYTRCFSKKREQRRVHYNDHQFPQDGPGSTQQLTVKAKYAEFIRWLTESLRRQEMEDEEKEAIMRRLHRSDGEEDDNLSTTMEQEIAQFRVAADVVSDMVTAEEGRSYVYPGEMQQSHIPTPLSPTMALPAYASVDDVLPAYDQEVDDSQYVADGFGYTPGSSYTPSELSGSSSDLDEHLGRKQ
ncbi:hypothetical protein F4810DRAFT_652972 [Camillea tinctor]|nr:hypothetical protein F4810DRAFT_652972 [Camillea tinctor]